MRLQQAANLRRLLNPRHIAFIGGRDAATAIGEARRIGFRGELWAVNPARQTLAGVSCFASVDRLPDAPDAAFIAVPVQAAVETTRQLSQMGAGGAVCYTAGFRETGDCGAAAERALVAAAGDMALIGPNCYGVINYVHRAALWPFAHGGSSPGYGAAIVTQSGMLSSDLTMTQRSLPLTHMVSLGNQSVLALEDMLAHFAREPAVRAIGLHIEGLRDVQAFAEAAVDAAGRGIAVVALKTGASAIGRSLTVSHTGSLSGEDDLYDALFERVGVVRVSTPAELMETLKLFCVSGPPRGSRIAGFTCSGGGATMLADGAEALALEFPPHGAKEANALRAVLPVTATVSNPLDYTTPIWGQPERTRPVFSAALAADADFALLMQDYPAPGLDESRPLYLADADAFADAAEAASCPAAVCSCLPENMDVATREHLTSRGVTPLQGLSETLTALDAGCRWTARRERMRSEPPQPLLPAQERKRWRVLSEADGKARLRANGIAVPEGRLVALDGLACVAATLDAPLVLKLTGDRIAHKSEIGAVALGLQTPQAVSAAARTIQRQVAACEPSLLTDMFLLERQQPPPLCELVLSVRRDPQFGGALTLGTGGVLVELLHDTRTVLLPAGEGDLTCALDGLALAKLLRGYRGGAPADRAAVIATARALMRLIEADPTVASVEINPLFVYEAGAVAVDVLMEVTA